MSGYKNQIDLFNAVYDFYNWRCVLTWVLVKRGYAYMYPHLFPKWSYPKLKLKRSNVILVQSTNLHSKVDVLFTRIREDIWKYELLEMINDWKDLAPMIKEYYNKDIKSGCGLM